MGKVELTESNQLRIVVQSDADIASLRAALRSVHDPDEVDLSKSIVLVDVENVDNVLATWACGFEWSPDAMARAIDELAPYARQSSSIGASGSLKSHKRMLRKIQDERGG